MFYIYVGGIPPSFCPDKDNCSPELQGNTPIPVGFYTSAKHIYHHCCIRLLPFYSILHRTNEEDMFSFLFQGGSFLIVQSAQVQTLHRRSTLHNSDYNENKLFIYWCRLVSLFHLLFEFSFQFWPSVDTK